MSNNTPDYEDNLVIDSEKTKELDFELRKENAKLKDLLKECVPYVNHRFLETRETLTKPYTASDKALHKKAEKLLTKIDEELKQDD